METFFEQVALSEIILYLSSGYIFIHLTRFITQRNDKRDYQYTILKSLVIGYIFTQLFHIVPSVTNNYYVDILIFISIITFTAYLCGIFCSSNHIRTFLRALHISTIVDDEIWQYMRDKSKPVWIRLRNTEKDIEIFGMWDTIECSNRTPYISLIRYSIISQNKKIDEDFNSNKTRKMLVDTSEYNLIEFIYDENSQNLRTK